MFSQLAIDKISRIVFVEGERGILKKIYIREIIKTRKKDFIDFSSVTTSDNIVNNLCKPFL